MLKTINNLQLSKVIRFWTVAHFASAASPSILDENLKPIQKSVKINYVNLICSNQFTP